MKTEKSGERDGKESEIKQRKNRRRAVGPVEFDGPCRRQAGRNGRGSLRAGHRPGQNPSGGGKGGLTRRVIQGGRQPAGAFHGRGRVHRNKLCLSGSRFSSGTQSCARG